jgi:hypothetical protein
MFSEKVCEYNGTLERATYVVTSDDVVLLGGKAGVAMTKEVAREWLRENWKRIEATIDQFIMSETKKL